MKLSGKWILIGLLSGALSVAGCGDDDGGGGGTDSGPGTDSGGGDDDAGGGDDDAGPMRTEVMVDSNITSDTTWTADNIYILNAQIFVTGAELTIMPGTEIRGANDSNVLVVTTTGTINAVGTADDPIVFTSNNPEGARQPSDWGGVVLLGRATINVTDGGGGTNTVEGLPPDAELGEYGGTDDSHNCGTMRYVRIEYAGFEFADNKEFNGLTVAGCGSDTTLEFIQVHAGSDDGIEFFGGSADLKWAVITRAQDDSLDTDEGYSGRIQFLIVMQDLGGDEGMEADNLEDFENNTPRSNPTIYNGTWISGGGDGQKGLRLRRGTAGTIANSIIYNAMMDDCIEVKDNETVEQANSGALTITNNMLFNCGNGEVGINVEPDDESPVTFTGDFDSVNDYDMDPMLPEINLTNPNFAPPAESPAASGAVAPPSDDFFENVTYRGAIEPGGTDWTAGWTTYPEFE